jgi:isoquinoline 1-oxidoreductase beta subunit
MRRRHFVLTALGATGALALGWSLLPPRSRLGAAGDEAGALNGWVKVTAADEVIVRMPRSEMGQGVHTGLALVLADELDADWARVRIEPAPIDNRYNNIATVVDGLPFHPDDQGALKRAAGWLTAKTMREIGTMVTGGSSSMKDLWQPLREAGASARAMLVAAAAQAWGVPAAEVQARAGLLSHPASGRSARYGAMAEGAARQPLAEGAALKTPAQFTLIGRDVPRLDSAAKSAGQAAYGLDVRLPGMLYASVVMCPTLGGRVAGFDAAAALQQPGVKQVLAVPGLHGGTAGVAVVATSPWQALKVADTLPVRWDEAVPAAVHGSAVAMDRMAQLLDHEDGFGYFRQGDVAAALKTAAKTISAEYRAPHLAHFTMEPQNCTVKVENGRATVWAPTQVPGFARWVAAQVLGLANEQVDLQVQLLGGGFGRRLDVDFVAQAAFIAKALPGVPVQTFWRREQDTKHDFYRPPAVARYRASLDAQGRLTAWEARSAGPSVLHQVLGRLFGLPGLGPDKTTAEGAFDQPYEWPAARIGHAVVESPVPVGFWRSVGHSHQAFFKESFIDEVAHAAGADPVAFRAALLQKHPRHLHVLQRAAALAGWGQPLAPAEDGAKKARGIALHQSFGSIVAQVAEVSLAADKAIRVHRVVCVIDCGTPVSPNLIRQQMDSAIVFGLSAALFGGVDIERGRVKQSNFHDQPVLRMAQCPAIECEIVASAEPPEGVGEPGTPPIAPAVANALFVLTGQRLRSLPLKVS